MAGDGYASRDIRVAAVGQDLIGWTEFLHGKVSVEIAAIQNLHCMSAPSCRITGADWMKNFISHLLQISHSQWIFRNYTLHDKRQGYLRLRLRKEVLREIHELLETPPSEVRVTWNLGPSIFFVRKKYWRELTSGPPNFGIVRPNQQQYLRIIPFWIVMLPAALVNCFASKFKSSSIGCPSIFVISYFSRPCSTSWRMPMVKCILVTNESIPKGFSYDC